MSSNWLNTKKHRGGGLLPLIALFWHGFYTILFLHPHNLLFVCYTANLFIGLGILWRFGNMVGIGFGWALLGLPLWIHYAIRNGDWSPSSIAFHLCGVLVGGIAIKDHKLSRYTWCMGLGLGILLFFISRIFTDESLNINAAFRVYEGWESLFPNYWIYLICMCFGFGSFFAFLTWFNNRYLYSWNRQYENC